MSSDPSSKKLFIISPIGDPLSENRVRSDQVKKFIIDPIAEKMGYKTCRADGISQPGIITDQIIERLLNDELVVADLTDQNPNVFYKSNPDSGYSVDNIATVASQNLVGTLNAGAKNK